MNKLFAILFLFALVFPTATYAQESNEIRVEVTGVVVDEITDGQRHVIFNATDELGKNYKIDSAINFAGDFRYQVKEGSGVILQITTDEEGNENYYFVDVVRSKAIFWIFALFALIAIAVGRARGALALIGLVVTILVLFGMIFPLILNGSDPVLVTVLGSMIILAVTMHLSHGFKRDTFTAFVSTILGLLLVVLFADLFVMISKLTGLGGEDAALLFHTTNNIAVPGGLLLAGIILGAVGVLDDIAITQTETVAELHSSNPEMSSRELFSRAMRVGRHHIASVINTLVLAYAGVAMPLFLLFLVAEEIGVVRFMNEEVVAEEIIRTMAGTTALVLLVPIATYLAAIAQKKKRLTVKK